jgi:catechol 2,3-dioxygenase-like lactoylglutathione lyase family enzyme
MGFAIDGVHHITLNITDLDRSKAFYAGVLGLEVDQDFPDYKVRLRLGPYTRLVLVLPLDGTPPGDRFSERRIGLDHVSLGVPGRADLERLVDVLRASGVETAGIQSDALGPGVVCFRDPDNIAWEFFEQP